MFLKNSIRHLSLDWLNGKSIMFSKNWPKLNIYFSFYLKRILFSKCIQKLKIKLIKIINLTFVYKDNFLLFKSNKKWEWEKESERESISILSRLKRVIKGKHFNEILVSTGNRNRFCRKIIVTPSLVSSAKRLFIASLNIKWILKFI